MLDRFPPQFQNPLIVLIMILLITILSNPASARDSDAKLLLHFRVPNPHETAQRYYVKVFDDGRVVYYGDFFVQTKGEVVYRIARNDLEEIVDIVRKSPLYQNRAHDDVTAALQLGYPKNEWAFRAEIDGVVISKLLDMHVSPFNPEPEYYYPLMQALESRLGTRRFRCGVFSDRALITKQLCEKSYCAIVIEGERTSVDLCGHQSF